MKKFQRIKNILNSFPVRKFTLIMRFRHSEGFSPKNLVVFMPLDPSLRSG